MCKLTVNVFRRVLFLCFLVCLPVSAQAAATIALSQVGDTSFTLLANGLDAPAGFDISMTYDSARLSHPRVVQGSLAAGAMLAANTGVPGSVHFALISTKPMAGQGVIATVSFDRIANSAGSIGLRGSVINLAGKNLPVSFSGWSGGNESGPIESSAGGSPSVSAGTVGTSTNSNTSTSAGGVAGTPFVVGGTLTMPSNDTAPSERKEAPVTPDPAQPQPTQQDVPEAPAPVSPEAAGVAVAQPTKNKPQGEPSPPVASVLERFRLFTGEKTPATLSALFDRASGAPFSQTPAICIADGVTSVTVTISKVAGDKAPNFSFNGVRYLSLRHTGDGEWQIETMPNKGTDKASIAMLTGGVEQEIPLAVSRPAEVDLDKSGTVTEADFQLFLQTRDTGNAPAFDLNGDGKRDYQDDYIFTANYLTKKGGVDKKEVVPTKKP